MGDITGATVAKVTRPTRVFQNHVASQSITASDVRWHASHDAPKGSAMKLVLMEFLSLDGVSQGPGSPDEDTSDGFTQGGWFVPYLDDSFLQIIVSWISEADAFLFGRRTYENFARDWPKQTDPSDPVATRL